MDPFDSHSRCLPCLGPDHDMMVCDHCQDFPYSQKLLRARRLAHWFQIGSDKCPTISNINKLVTASEKVPQHLLLENVSPFFVHQPKKTVKQS